MITYEYLYDVCLNCCLGYFPDIKVVVVDQI